MQMMPPLPQEGGWFAQAHNTTFYALAIGGWLMR